MGYSKKVCKDSSTDLALTPPQREWTKEQLDSRMQKHANTIEKATANARTSSIESDTDNKKPDVLSDFGFNKEGS